MIISHQYKFIYIATPKTGSQSVEAVLRPLGTSVSHDAITKHKTALEIREDVGLEVWQEYFTFGFVRNTWDWVASLYTYGEKLKAEVKLGKKKYATHLLSALSPQTFEQFVEALPESIKNKKHLAPQYKMFYDNNEQIVDFIGNFNRLKDDLDLAINRSSGEYNRKLRQLPHHNFSKSFHYSRLYSPKTKQIVEEIYKKDIELFKFEYQKESLVQSMTYNSKKFIQKLRSSVGS